MSRQRSENLTPTESAKPSAVHRPEELDAESTRKYKKGRRPRGEGSVVLKHNAWHLRPHKVVIDGQKVTSVKLCNKDDLHYSAVCPAVRELAKQKVEELKRASSDGTEPKADMPVADFWNDVYLPWGNEVNPKVGEANLRPSTLNGYEQVWNQHLKNHFGSVTLSKYKTVTATEFLTTLAKTQGRNTIMHIRSLMSGIFTRAVKRGYLEANPVSNAGVDGKTAKPAKTGHYSLRESLSILAALADYTECHLVMALSFFWGLRPSEIRGLRWEDFCFEPSDDCSVCQDGDWEISCAHAHVRRGIDKKGNVNALKTDEAEAPLPLMVPIAIPLQVWREDCGNPIEGWLFQTKNGTPADLRDWVRTKIRPTLIVKGLKWKGLYAGRRGAATMLLQLTGNALASQQLLRHKPGSAVTAKHYLKAIPEALLAGAKLVEAAVEKALNEAT